MKYYVEINGVSSLTIQGLAISELPSISKPLIRTQREEIDGRDGDIITKLGYSAYDKSLKIGLWGNYDINEVIAFFNTDGKITFSNEPDKYYYFTILNRADFINQLEAFRTATITIHCQPFKYMEQESPEFEREYVEKSGTSITWDNSLEAPLEIDLKGNTIQNGTPTPSSPIPINNVSGDNDIVVCGKNLFDKDNIKIVYGSFSSSDPISQYNVNVKSLYIPCSANTTYTISKDNTSNRFRAGTTSILPTNGVSVSDVVSNDNGKKITLTTGNSAKYLIVYYWVSNDSSDIVPNSLQIEVGNQQSTYTPYTGTTYNIDLPSANEFNKNTTPIFNGYISNDGLITSNANNRILYIPIRENTTYTIEKILGNTPRFRMCLTDVIPANNVSGYNYDANDNATSMTITNTTHKYLCVWYWTSASTTPESDIKDSIVIYKGTTRPETIELNKIGTYQDYIYKENDKWYLHKEIGKVVLNGSEEWIASGKAIFTRITNAHCLSNQNADVGDGSIDYVICDNFAINGLGDIYTYGTTGITLFYMVNNPSEIRLAFGMGDISVNDFKTWLSTHNTIVYYEYETSTNTEITYTPLIEQLNTLEEAQSYEGTTNINQVNNDLPFIIYATVLCGTDNLIVNNLGNIIAKPVMTITGSGDIGVYLNGSQIFNIALGDEEYITIDIPNMEAHKDDTLKNRLVVGDYNSFVLQPGENTISFTGDVSDYDITNYSRWI